MHNGIDRVALARRLAAIAADVAWPEMLRDEAARGLDEDLDADDLSDPAIITALNRRSIARAEGPTTGPATNVDVNRP
ncbi:hypothetical protein [Asanoa ishikariensis]|uniref:hypothetical protein n=1 Tax=Asanoa ishikariensis TaxID=137265 RepID=UPI000B83766F|nr:hypothetical protein [Asanoa ishikariensis]